MKRIVKAVRRRLTVEGLEVRALLSASPADEIFVKFAATDPARTQAAVTTYPSGDELLSLGSGVTPSTAIGRLQGETGVVYATPDSIIHTESTPFYPDDPDLSQDWGLNQANNVDIDAPEAYGVTLGSAAVIVAVIDTGIDLNDPDFAGKIWTNPGNDAASGYPDDVHGWNFVSDDNDVQDDNGHGTHVSAVIAAQGNNDYGIVGVAPGVQVMPLKFLDENGNGSTDNAVSAIYYAVEHGARVINASWGGVEAYGPLDDAIAYANAHNTVFVTAAGNDGTDNDVVPSYPASYAQPNELSVAAIDQNGALASFSNYGPGTVNLAAPGVDIVSEVPTSIDPSGLETLSGTSMSTAYVSGVAALVATVDPTFSAAQIVQRIDSTVKILPSLEGTTISGGMVDAYNAVTGDTPTFVAPAPVAGIPVLVPGEQSQTQLHAVVLASDEFFAAQGSTEIGFIAGLYEAIDARLPSYNEIGLYEQVYNSGTTTRFLMALNLLDSAEAKETEVARWYQTDLGRTTPLAFLKVDTGVQNWANLLLEGDGDNAVQAAILASPEYLYDHGSSPDPVVQGYYVLLTGRYADPGGLNYWANQLYAGAAPYNVVDSFLGTAEVADTLVATWFIEDLGRTGSIASLKANPGLDALAADLGSF
jgi:thermitase